MTGSSSGISMRSIFSSSLMRLHLLGLGGLGAEAVDEGLKVLDLMRWLR
jgi:hypothetical protein